jgi:hypothetical protein
MISCPPRRALFLAAALALVGCRDKEPNSGSAETNLAGQTGPPRPATGARSIAGPASATTQLAAAIPNVIQGRWGLVPADCTSRRGDAKGLLTISDKELRFYESRAKLGRIAVSSPTRIDADFAFSGEGMTWARRMTLDAQDDGRTLVRREYGEDASPGALRYARCP